MLGVMGGGARWLIHSVEARNKEAATEQALARLTFSNRLLDEIAECRRAISKAEDREKVFTRRIYMLEDLIRSVPALAIPAVPWWPP